ncbi:DUF4199 domain-containing protein [Algibacter pacificus]|uniref:DUF4199 domain-containing protein n=1 Tax=Algibacter pacificus TaxID=2599389 RepID=UPI0011C82F7B|nr:DUF4199 domain-containing protein [Algibacter pacificus]
MKKIALSLRFGLATSAILIAYFLVLGLFNLHINPLYSLFNFVIIGLGVYEVVRLRKLQDIETFSYSEGFKTGLFTGSFATVVFSVFFLIYSTEINLEYLPKLVNSMNGNFNINAGLITFIVAVMGFTTTLISTLVVMQRFKISQNISENR